MIIVVYYVMLGIQTSLYFSNPISVRDILFWIKFINQSVVKLGPESSFYHGACLVFLDAIGCGSGKMELISRSAAEIFISSLFAKHGKKLRKPAVTAGNEVYGISPFFIERGKASTVSLFRKRAHGSGIFLSAQMGWGGANLCLQEHKIEKEGRGRECETTTNFKFQFLPTLVVLLNLECLF